MTTHQRPIHQRITKARHLGYYCDTTHGIGVVGEVPLHAWTRRGIERKAARLARKLDDTTRRHRNATEIQR